MTISNGCQQLEFDLSRSIHRMGMHGNATLGNLLEAKDLGASQYPNQIRYGDSLKHYPPEIMLTAAKTWVNEHWNRIRIAQQDGCT